MEKELSLILDFDQDLEVHLNKMYPNVNYKILSKSLDARKAPLGRKPKYVYKILINPSKSFDLDLKKINTETKPLIVGSGPAGLFAALRLKDYGIQSIVFERGEPVLERMKSISKFWRYGELNEESNVCYGEGGAGLFSDGKLYTRVKSPFIKYVLRKLVDYGADEEILYVSNPHLGSHKIRKLIKEISKELIEFGSEIHFNTEVKSLIVNNDQVEGLITSHDEKFFSSKVILAAGHSPRDFYQTLHKQGVEMKKKDFAVGVRVEHKRDFIDKAQLGEFSDHLGAASYRLSFHDKKVDRGTYSFCMCPGGYVLSSGTEKNKIVTNGMSNDSHNSSWSNAGIVVSVKSDKLEGDVFSGFDFIEDIEAKAFEESKKVSSGKELPAMTLGELRIGKLNDGPLPKSSVPSKLVKVNFNKIFPDFIIQSLIKAFEQYDKKLPGFSDSNVLLIAPETRTSSPITVVRDKQTLESSSINGLYPCGEGAGYAGGITSAAVDGIKVVESLIKELS